MEAPLVSAATGALKPVIGKLFILLGDEYKRFKGVRKEIESLTHELAAMEAFLLKMSEEEDPDVQDKVWMNEVRELSYDMEDSIDDFMQSVHHKDAKPDGFMEKIKHSLGKFRKMKTRHRIGNEIQDLKKQIVEVGERNKRYKTSQAFSNYKNAIVDLRALAIFEHASKLIGIDEPMGEIIRLLTKENGLPPTEQQQLKVVSIVGSGGMGKTTLANQVYQDLRGKFECRAFVSVSRHPDIINILRTILAEVSNQDYAHTEAGSIQQLICKICDTLAEKRYFVVIDDIWDVKTWDVIKHAFPMTSCGSIIITTTRIIGVACSCRSSIGGHIYNMRGLNMVHSRQLLHRRLFNSEEDCPPSLENISEQILKKCDGLPLAIIAISGLLANTGRTEHLWNQVKDSIGHALERNPSVEGMIKILSLSYFDLPPRLKGCLLYLSIFPEDSCIHTHMLIWRWIAEGLIHKEGRYTAYEIGKICLNELVNRSLVQLVQDYEYEKFSACRVHDIILDFIVSKSIDENFVTFVGVPCLTTPARSRVRRLSLHQVEGEEISAVPKGLILSHVRSLHVFGDTVKIPSMLEFRHLRVMDFEGCSQLENHHLVNIGRLFQLRYLNISNTCVKELPEEIGHLRCLEILDISGMKLCDLPAGIVNLEKLAHLFVGDEVRFPDGIVNLQALETLRSVRASNQSCIFLQELGQLKNLRKLTLCYWQVSQEHEQVIASSLHNLCTQNLRSLTLWFPDDSMLLNTWCTSPPVNLQRLLVHSYILPKVPDWVGCLVNLQKLCLELEIIQHEDLCMLGALPALVTLKLENNDMSHCEDRKLTISRETGFRCLRVFNYTQGYRMLDLLFTERCMPKLEKLEIWLHGVEHDSLSSAGAFHFGIDNLASLITFRFDLDCGPATRSTVDAVKDSLEKAVSTNSNSHLNLIFESHGCQSWLENLE